MLQKGRKYAALFLFLRKVAMLRVVIYLKDQEHSTLGELAEREYRTIQAQAAMIIRKKLESLGLLSGESPLETTVISKSAAPVEEEHHANR